MVNKRTVFVSFGFAPDSGPPGSAQTFTMRSTDQVLHRLRALCLQFPETSESASWGHPNFRAGRRTFATFEIVSGRPSIAFRMNHADIERLLRRRQFFITPYGRGQWVSAWADTTLDWTFITDLLRRSYRTVALKRMISALEKRPSKP
jgi:predicted DNA-binding protein (MmcQ/YjbR family)